MSDHKEYDGKDGGEIPIPLRPQPRVRGGNEEGPATIPAASNLKFELVPEDLEDLTFVDPPAPIPSEGPASIGDKKITSLESPKPGPPAPIRPGKLTAHSMTVNVGSVIKNEDVIRERLRAVRQKRAQEFWIVVLGVLLLLFISTLFFFVLDLLSKDAFYWFAVMLGILAVVAIAAYLHIRSDPNRFLR